MRKLLFLIFTAMALAFAANYIICRYCAPDQVYFRQLGEVSEQWAQTLRKQHPSIYVTCGGSSGRFSINPQQILDEYDIPLVTANGNAGFGVIANTALAWNLLEKGDTLILSHEEGLRQAQAPLATTSGLQQSLQRCGFAMFKDDIIPLTPANLLMTLRGSSTFLSTTCAKSFYPVRERYRYFRTAHVHPSGWAEIFAYPSETLDDSPLPSFTHLNQSSISTAVKEHYQHVLEVAKKRGIHVIAHQSTSYKKHDYRLRYIWTTLELTRMGIPVVKIPDFNLMPDRSYVADQNSHLNAKGSRLTSANLGQSLKDQSFWTEEELVHELKLRGWNGDGSKMQPSAQSNLTP